ncbi:MAG: DUF2332 domain-containing protein [Solirubrobacteraceae bacterium]
MSDVGREHAGDLRAAVAGQLRDKSEQARALGSGLYGELFASAAQDVERGGLTWEVLREHAHDGKGSALALRFASAVHRIVLEGGAPRLAGHYPSVGGTAGRRGLWPAFQEVLAEHADRLRGLVAGPLQTNEVGRSAALLSGFLMVARDTALPLRLLELGASAGLNLLWDAYRYEAGTASFGPRASPVRFAGVFAGRPPPLHVSAAIASRRGCDASPLDPRAEETRLTLLSATWPDQLDRIERLDSALGLARMQPPTVDRADVCQWLQAGLAEVHDGVATVVFHSIVWQYLSGRDRRRLVDTLNEAGARATSQAPLAWLRMEPPGELATVRLTTWPGAADRVIAHAGYHGEPVIVGDASAR